MKKWFSLFFVLLVIALTGCQTYRGDGAAAGAGTYPLKTSPASDDTVLITVVDSSKAGGFDIRRTPMANIPVSTPVQTALNLKQDASTAVTADDVQDAIDEAIAGVDGSTITADTTDPTKAAAAVAADSATYATTAGTAGTVAAVSGDAVTSGTIADARISSTIARDSEVSASISSAIAGKFDTPTGTIYQVVLGNGTLGSLPAGSTITADTVDNTKAAAAVVSDTATTALAVSPTKTSGVASVDFLYEANGPDTDGNGFIGPLNATKKYLFRIDAENGTVAVDQVMKIGSIATNQTVPMGSGSMVADIVTLILADESGGGASLTAGSTTNDILKWDGDSWEPCALSAHPEFAALVSLTETMTSAFNALGLNIFSFAPTSGSYPRWANTSPVAVSFDVTDTSSTYAVSDVDYQYDGTGGFVSNMTNTTGDTWTADVAIATDGAHTIQFEATDDKAGTPNTGQSAVYTINFDATDPGVGTVTPNPATHNGTGTAIEVTIASITEANEASRQYRIYDVTDAAVEEAYQSFTGLTISETLPADQHTYRFDVLVTDSAGNTGTASSANIAYSAGASCADGTCAGFLVCQNFEGTGYDNSETWTETVPTDAVVNEDDTTSPIGRGSQSLSVIGSSSAAGFSTKTYTAQSSIYFHSKVKFSDVTPSSNMAFLSFGTGANVYLRTDGKVQVYSGSSNIISASAAFAADNTWYHVWGRMANGSGTNAVYQLWVGETNDFDAATMVVDGSNGTYTSTFSKVDVNSTRNYSIVYTDQVLVSTGYIGDVCE